MLIFGSYVPVSPTLRSMIVALAMALVVLLLDVAPAWATKTCTFSSATVNVRANAASEVITVRRGAGNDGNLGTSDDAIQSDAASPGTFLACGTATVSNTDEIDVLYSGSGSGRHNQVIVIDLSNGDFVPGATAEGSGTNEIEFDIDLGAGNGDTLSIVGGSGVERINFGLSDAANCAGGTSQLTFNLNSGEATDDCDTIDALAGVEVYSVDGQGGDDIISFNGGEGTGTAFDAAFPYTISGGVGDDELVGSSQPDTIAGGAGDDDLSGGEGDDDLDGGGDYDALAGGAGADTLSDSGAGNDTLNYITSPSGVIVDLASGTASGGDATGDVISAGAFENVVGSDFADTLSGTSSVNVLLGGLGDDVLNGGGGDDVLNAQRGADTLNGEGGNDGLNPGRLAENDIVRGGDASGDAGAKDRANYTRCENPVTIDLTVLAAQDTGCGSDTLNGIEQVRGSANADTLTGDANDNFFVGGAGADTLNGGGGADLMQGFRGADQVNGQDGNDTLYGGDADDTITGGAGSDYANGEAGSNDSCVAEAKENCEA